MKENTTVNDNLFEEVDEFKVRDELKSLREEIKTFDDLVAFLDNVKNNYNTDYGVAPRAIAQAALAVAWYLSGEFGITGFQAGFVMLDFMFGWNYTNNKCGLRIIDFDKMLYPQYDYIFDKTISTDKWHEIQKAASEMLDARKSFTHPSVKAHWERIVGGAVPFGYRVVDND